MKQFFYSVSLCDAVCFTDSQIKAELSSKTPDSTSMCNNHVTLCLYYSSEYYSQRDCT